MYTKIYKPKDLIDGRVLGLPLGKYVAVPKQKVLDGGVTVKFGNERMIISSNLPHLMSRKFQDKFYSDKYYTLFYYRWDPNVQTLGI